MKVRSSFPKLELALGCVLFFPALLSPQRPQLPGKLSIASMPPGANITIDNQATGRVTDFTFGVSPGMHSVKLTGKAPKQCAEAKFVTVAAGGFASVLCTSMGWEK